MKERNYGIDLLRLVLMFMVCILHVLGQGGVLSSSIKGTAYYSIFWFMETFCFCAVDAFALISGYTAVNKHRKYEKLVNIWLQVFFYSFIVTIIFLIIGKADNIGTMDIIRNALPITYAKYWYMTAYFLLFLSIPILNNFLFKISERSAKKVFIILVLLFMVMGLFGDPFTTRNGYSALWLMVLYCIGLLGKRIDIFGKKKSLTLIFIWALCILSTWCIYVYLDNDKLLNYISPTILFSGLIMVILFKRLQLNGKIISKLSPLALGIYLLQLNQVVWNNILKNAFQYILNENIFMAILLVLLYAFLIFIVGLVVEFIRSKLSKLLKLDIVSKKVVKIIDLTIEKLTFVLK